MDGLKSVSVVDHGVVSVINICDANVESHRNATTPPRDTSRHIASEQKQHKYNNIEKKK